jgi:hypothetical protein
MRIRSRSVFCLGLVAMACDGGNHFVIPMAPSQAFAPAPTPAPIFVFAEPYTQITVGEVVKGQVTGHDPVCDSWNCQYFRLTAPSDGRLQVMMTYSIGTSTGSANLDLFVTDSAGRQWWYPDPVPAKGGATYQIAVLEYESPGVEFELRTSMQAN